MQFLGNFKQIKFTAAFLVIYLFIRHGITLFSPHLPIHFVLFSVNHFTSFSFTLGLFFYHIHLFTQIHHSWQVHRSSAGEEPQPFSSTNHRHSSREVIYLFFASMGLLFHPGQLCFVLLNITCCLDGKWIGFNNIY